jgi:hypothetical protein
MPYLTIRADERKRFKFTERNARFLDDIWPESQSLKRKTIPPTRERMGILVLFFMTADEEVQDLIVRTELFRKVLQRLVRDFDKMLDDAPAGYFFDRLEITAFATDGTPFYRRAFRAANPVKESNP